MSVLAWRGAGSPSEVASYTRGRSLLKSMLDSLSSADAVDPNYDRAGPSRVRALVLIRAPGWPLGPGDADAGLDSARRAVGLRPQYPPNLLALAEALSKTGDAGGARDAYAKARDAARRCLTRLVGMGGYERRIRGCSRNEGDEAGGRGARPAGAVAGGHRPGEHQRARRLRQRWHVSALARAPFTLDTGPTA